MSSTYLRIAKEVLEQARAPLTPARILELAYAAGLVPSHLHGDTQHKTLHARLSEEISLFADRSDFVRTGPGRFFLRSLQGRAETPTAYKVFYNAPPRRKELKRDLILCAELKQEEIGTSVPIEALRDRLECGKYRHLRWDEVRGSSRYSPVSSFVVVHNGGSVLSYRRGKFRAESDILRQPRSIGFGGAVLASDNDLLFDSFYGILGSGLSELSFGVGLPRDLVAQARYHSGLIPAFGYCVQSEEIATTFMNVVLIYRCPGEFTPFAGALSLNDLRWVSWTQPSNDPDDFDETSRVVFREHSALRIS